MSIELKGNLLLAGAGNMGGALVAGWLARGLDPRRLIVQDPAPARAIRDLLQRHHITAVGSASKLPEPPAVLVVAVKPQVVDQVLPSLSKLVGPNTTVLSVAAGRTITSFERQLASGTAVVRSIPNMAAAVGRAITVAVANTAVTAAQRSLCDELLRAIGEVAWVDDEALIDLATAVSGSGPAYVFLLTECLSKAGVEAGLTPDLAMKLARSTVVGAGELLYRSPLRPDQLREGVTSPNGTTFAALQVLMGACGGTRGLQSLLSEAVAAAARRAKELAQ
jgi:pyrroline-5-carboxylate reductase